MADNIKIVGSILNTTTVSRYSEKDIVLLQSRNLQNTFGGVNDSIEYYIYDIGETLLNTSYNYLDYKLSPSNGLIPAINTTPNTTGNIESNNVVSTYTPTSGSIIPIIEIDPIQDLQNNGYSSGEFRVQYNFFTNILSNPIDRALFVKEISSDRTEIRLASTTLTNDEIEKVANSMIDEINNSTYYVDYLLNFSDNRQYVAVNIVLNKTTEGNEILFKLYESLPLEIQEKDTLWVVQEKANPYVFELNLDKLITPPPLPTLRSPNFDIEVENQGTVSTSYKNYQTLVSGLQSLQNSSYQQILNLLATQSVNINVDYTDFNNFIFFGSSYQRVYNFYNKVKSIEDYRNFITAKSPLTSSTPSLIVEINQISSSINDVVSKFDGYESYLYFESSSYTWPKSNSSKPYTLLSTGSAITLTWYNALISSTEDYDKNNYNNLEYAIPIFIKEDENNAPYLTFLNMVGHYFDNIWIYLQAITDVNLANNNLNYGISKDLVYEQLKSLGIKIYNSQAGESVDQFLIGSNTGSSLWSNDFSPTSSYLNNIPRKDLVSELYKRIYHNLPLLLKQKGTVEGLNNLMTVFGIPNKTYYTVGSESFYTPTGSSITASILSVKEYGGSLKSNLIKGYNDDKVRILPNSLLTGSILSPIASLQTYPTASSQFRDDDMHYVDVSFSPQTQINNYISGAIASNSTTWSLDDFIGDPRYLYSSSYGLLDTERKKYYQTGVSGYAPFTASALDYNGFIRLIEHFDNALFKMLGDFVPERTSLSTGVTFESPVLERNKTPYALPSAYTGSVYEGEIDSIDISSEYGNFYNHLTGSKKAWYDGDITGSYIDVYDYFENSNPNSYLSTNPLQIIATTATWYTSTEINSITAPWIVINPGIAGDNGLILSSSFAVAIANQTPLKVTFISGESIGDNNNSTIIPTGYFTFGPGDPTAVFYISFRSLNQNVTANTVGSRISFTDSNYLNEFQHTDFNVLLNNVSKNVESKVRKRIEYIYGTTGSITSNVELQDSYLTLQSHINSRYDGSKSYSLKYNDYTPSGSIIFNSSISNVNYSLISSSYGWDGNVDDSFSGNGFYTTLYLTGSAPQLAEIVTKLNIPGVKYIKLSTPNPFIPDTVTSKFYEVNRFSYYTDSILMVDDTKLAIALSPNLKIFDGVASYTDSGELPTITGNYGPGTLTLGFYKEWDGDKSYGKSAAIDRQSYKLGWIRTVPSRNLNFYDKTTFDLKYLIDPNLQITELSSNNNNLFEVQNTFKSSTPVQVSVTNVNFPSNQVKLDGTKNIFKGGFRYDPILFRENNETLTFIFDEPISQSIDYLGFNIRGEDWYQYHWFRLPSTTYLSGQGPYYPPAGLYYYNTSENNIDTQSTPMAYAVYNTGNWSVLAGGKYLNFSGSNPTQYGPNQTNNARTIQPPNSRLIYGFDLLKFPTTIFNTEGESVTGEDNLSFFKVPRTGDSYEITGQIPVIFRGKDTGTGNGGGTVLFKFVAIIEKSISPLSSDWEPIAVSSLVKQIEQGNVDSDETTCGIVYDDSGVYGFYQCTFNENNVSLNQNDYLRLRFYIITYTDLFGDVSPSETKGTEEFTFTIGGSGAIEGIFFSEDKKAFIEITDLATEYTQYYYTSSYSDNVPFFITSSNNSIETLSPQAYSFFETSSTFFPTSDTQNNYTQVTDRFSIQSGDLFRFGPFKQNKPPYYTVTNVENTTISPILIDTARFIQLPSSLPGIMVYDLFEYQYAKFYPGDIINITGTANNNLINAEVKSVQISGSFVNLFFDSTTSNNIVTENPVGNTITASFVNPIIKITFDRELTDFNPISFAVLRPKPDETSVIVNYIKPPGDVSQTLLIPSDANQTLKDKTGDIFEYYNPRLNPSTQNQQS